MDLNARIGFSATGVLGPFPTSASVTAFPRPGTTMAKG